MTATVALALLVAASPETARERVAAVLAEPPSFAPVFLGGTEEKVPAKPRRIVTVAPSVTELIFALGAGDRVIGVSRYDEEPPAVRALPKVGGFIDPNIEAILAQRPDLVAGVPNAGARPVLERVARMGVPVLIVPGNTFADVFHATRALAPVLGGDAPARAKVLLAQLERDLIALSSTVSGRPAPRVAFVYGWTPLVLAGPGSFADTLLRVLNARNVVTRGPQYPQIALERLIEDAPEVIIDASERHEAGESPWARFSTIPAVANKRVHVVRAQDLLVPGPRIAIAARRLAELLHPSVFTRR